MPKNQCQTVVLEISLTGATVTMTKTKRSFVGGHQQNNRLNSNVNYGIMPIVDGGLDDRNEKERRNFNSTVLIRENFPIAQYGNMLATAAGNVVSRLGRMFWVHPAARSDSFGSIILKGCGSW